MNEKFLHLKKMFPDAPEEQLKELAMLDQKQGIQLMSTPEKIDPSKFKDVDPVKAQKRQAFTQKLKEAAVSRKNPTKPVEDLSGQIGRGVVESGDVSQDEFNELRGNPSQRDMYQQALNRNVYEKNQNDALKSVMTAKDQLLTTGAGIRAGKVPNSQNFVQNLPDNSYSEAEAIGLKDEMDFDQKKELQQDAITARTQAAEQARLDRLAMFKMGLDQKNNSESRRGKQADRQFVAQAWDKLNSDPAYKNATQSQVAARTAKAMAMSGNPLADGSIPSFLARATGEVGALTESDKAPFGGSRALDSKIQQVIEQAATGRITPENQQFVVQLAELMERNSDEIKEGRKAFHANKLKKTGFVSDLNEAMEMFSEEPVQNIQQPTNNMQTKIIKGVKYQKVNGGWQAVK